MSSVVNATDGAIRLDTGCREFTIVLRGALVVESDGSQMTVQAGQAVHTRPGEWVRYSTPGADGAEYISVCLPAFAPDTVHRDE